MERAPTPWLQQRSKALRAGMTPQERIVWNVLRTGELRAPHWRRQSALGGYILDFVSHSAKLVVEVDGAQHGERDQIEHDGKRTAWLKAQGYRVLRFWNYKTKVAQNEIWLAVHGAAMQTPARIRMQRWRAADFKNSKQANANLPLDGGGGREAAGGGAHTVDKHGASRGSQGKDCGPHPLSPPSPAAPADSSPIEGERK